MEKVELYLYFPYGPYGLYRASVPVQGWPLPFLPTFILIPRLATGWTVRRSNPGRGEIFRTRPHRPWGPPSVLYTGYRVFSGGKSAGAWRWLPTPSSAEVNERVGLYLYSPLRAFVTCSRVSFILISSFLLIIATIFFSYLTIFEDEIIIS